MAIKNKFVYRLSLWIVPFLFGLIMRVLLSTCRIVIRGGEYLDQCDKAGTRFLNCFWHYSVLCVTEEFYRSGRKWVAMISSSDDAEYLVRLLRSRGCVIFRGSQGKAGIKSIRGVIEWVKKGHYSAFAGDGSQGPVFKMQAGVLLLASRTGKPVIPMVVAADRYVAFRSWDRTLLPKPFANIDICYGEPFVVPSGLKMDEMEPYRQQLEERMNNLYVEAWRRFGKEGH